MNDVQCAPQPFQWLDNVISCNVNDKVKCKKMKGLFFLYTFGIIHAKWFAFSLLLRYFHYVVLFPNGKSWTHKKLVNM